MDVSKIYTRVDEAIKRKNFDFAVELLKNHILKYNPNDVKGRQLLRMTLRKKYELNGAPSKADLILKSGIPAAKMFVGKLLKKWDLVIDEAENFLISDPNNLWGLNMLGEAAMAAGYLDTAVSVFEDLLTCNRNHVNALTCLGRIFEQKNDLERANQYYQKAARLSNDLDLTRKAKDMAAQITARTYEGASSSHDLIRDKEKAKELEQDQAILRTEEDILQAIERTRKKLMEDPESKKQLRRLGDLYQKLGKYTEAAEAYEKIYRMDPTAFDIKVKIGDCKIQHAAQRIRKIRENIKKSPENANLKHELQKALKVKNTIEIEEYQEQVKGQPMDQKLRFKLGSAFFRAGRMDEAIASFQNAIDDSKCKVPAYIYMGQAFSKKKEYELAVEQFQSVLKLVNPKENQYRDILYHLGSAYEAAGKYEEAITEFTKIYKVDISFRDVQEKLKRLRELKGG